MQLYAISDIHLGHLSNREALKTLQKHSGDWLILAGDVGETGEQLRFALDILTQRFERVLWVPGNHDLWTLPTPHPTELSPEETVERELRGVAKYERLVAICREYGVVTPEDPYALWTGEGGPCLLAPLFLLYDYSFRPPEIPLEQAVTWAEEERTVCVDEYLLHPDPFASRIDWCHARCASTEQRLQQVANVTTPFIFINHFPLHPSMAQLRRIPRFSLWCGTTLTTNWHTRFPTKAVIFGHVHIRARHYLDGVRFEEVSLGYPQQWNGQKGIEHYLRRILPAPPVPQQVEQYRDRLYSTYLF